MAKKAPLRWGLFRRSTSGKWVRASLLGFTFPKARAKAVYGAALAENKSLRLRKVER